jgi:hypothetical protein
MEVGFALLRKQFMGSYHGELVRGGWLQWQATMSP